MSFDRDSIVGVDTKRSHETVKGLRAWTGTCGVDPKSGREQIFALWHTVRSNSGFDWDHTLTGAEPFVPVK